MPRCIAFLRAINVGGRNIKMDALRSLFAQLPLKNIETFIASGNVIFDAPSAAANTLEEQIEAHLLSSLGYEVKTFIRTPAQVADIISHPVLKEPKTLNATALSIGLLRQALNRQQQQALRQLETDIDGFHAHDREVYWYCLAKQSESKFSNTLFEKRLGISTTFRGIKTLQRLAAKYPA